MCDATVYLVICGYETAGSWSQEVIGVFSTEEAAQTYAQQAFQEYLYEWGEPAHWEISIEGYVLDQQPLDLKYYRIFSESPSEP